MNAALGAGLLNFPKAFDQAGGVLVAVLVQASLLVFIMIALYILATTSDIKQSTTLQEAMHTAAGPWGRRLTSLIVTVIPLHIRIRKPNHRITISFSGVLLRHLHYIPHHHW